jgi:hypothetical protein
MTNKIQIKIFLFSAFIFNQAYSVDLQPPTTLKTAPSGTPINAPGQNKEFLCIPGVPEDITIQQTNNFWLDDLNLIISEYNTVAVEGDVYNGPSFFYTTLTETERHFHGNGIPILGYALDGFGIYGPRGDGGKLLTNNDLDACHGHMGIIDWDGNLQYMYHYHLNTEFPYGPGCFRGLPALITSFQALVHVHGAPIPPHT